MGQLNFFNFLNLITVHRSDLLFEYNMILTSRKKDLSRHSFARNPRIQPNFNFTFVTPSPSYHWIKKSSYQYNYLDLKPLEFRWIFVDFQMNKLTEFFCWAAVVMWGNNRPCFYLFDVLWKLSILYELAPTRILLSEITTIKIIRNMKDRETPD